MEHLLIAAYSYRVWKFLESVPNSVSTQSFHKLLQKKLSLLRNELGLAIMISRVTIAFWSKFYFYLSVYQLLHISKLTLNKVKRALFTRYRLQIISLSFTVKKNALFFRKRAVFSSTVGAWSSTINDKLKLLNICYA